MSDVNLPQFWQQSYEEGHFPWDLGGPTPVFQRLVESGRFPAGRMIVLGAGRGYDARLFARHGFVVLIGWLDTGALIFVQFVQIVLNV